MAAMLAPYQDDPDRNGGPIWPNPGRKRYWRDLGLRAAAFVCLLLAALFAVVAFGNSIIK